MSIISLPSGSSFFAPSYRIRPAKVDDIQAVAALQGSEALPGADPESAACLGQWRDLFKRFGSGRAGHHFLVAARDGECVGFALGEVGQFEFMAPRTARVFALFVGPSHRDQGIGTALYDALCVRFRGDGVTTVRLMVPRENVGPRSAMAFCRRQGMKTGSYFQLEKAIAP